jgi:hypothetical protein
VSPTTNKTSKNGRAVGVGLKKHLDALRVADLKDVYAFWSPDENGSDLQKKKLVDALHETMSHEGTVYRRVRTLTRKVLDVLLLLLRRSAYQSDVPGLFQRLPGETPLELEYHEAEAGVKALRRRGFLAEVSDRRMASNGRVAYAVPLELGEMLTGLFRQETRTVGSVFSLEDHLTAITAAERQRLRAAFPALPESSDPSDAKAILGKGGATALLDRLDDYLKAVVLYAIERHGGLMLRANWSARRTLRETRWNRDRWTEALEGAGIGTLARLSLRSYGIACEDEALVVFDEVLEDLYAKWDEREPQSDEVLRPGGDVVADLCAFLEHVRRHPVKVGRGGEVHKAARRRITSGFVYRESFLAGPLEIWAEVYRATNVMDLIRKDKEGFLELTPQAEAFLKRPLEEKASELYHVALEQAGSEGRSLHLHEIRNAVAELLRESPERWWSPRALASVGRHRYLATLDERGIKERHRDRYFSAYFSGKETPRDLKGATERDWLRHLHILGMLDVAAEEDHVVACRLSPLGARVLGATSTGLDTGLRPILVNPDFEVVVLPEGDVSDVVHTLDGYAQRIKTGEVAHFRLTKESVESAVGAGRSTADLLAFLESRSRGGVPQNVAFTIRRWSENVTFATLERGVVLKVEEAAALERILALDGIGALLIRRLGETEALLKDAPKDKKLIAGLRTQGVHLQGP